MDSAIGRFTTIDTHSENYYSWSPYAYVGNNPMKYIDPDGKDWRDFIRGIVDGVENNFTVGITDAVGAGHQNGVDNGSHYNSGRTVGDIMSFAGALVEIVSGGTISAAGGTVTVATLGTASPVSVPATALGVGLVVHGSAVMGTSLQGNGRVSEANNSSSGGRGSNHLKPAENATGAHSSFRRDAQGNITNTTTYKENPKNPTGFDEVKRVDKTGISHKNRSGQEVPTPHVHEKKDVRPARVDEIPKPKN